MTNKLSALGWGLLPVVLTCGCSSMNNTESGALTGGALGAVGGAIVGAAARAPLAGAAIGAVAGTAIGAAAGHAEDKAQARAVAYRENALPINSVVYLAQSHVPDANIINQIRTTGALYHLSANDIVYLRQQGVSDVVIAEMQATVTYATQGYAPGYYVVEPAPAPVVAVGIRGRF